MKRYLIKLYEECMMCNGKGRMSHTEVAPGYENIGSTTMVRCYYCKGSGTTEILSNRKNFKKLYIKELQRVIGKLNIELSDVRKTEFSIMKEMRKYNKELDKIIN